jgi:hypothetical protein
MPSHLEEAFANQWLVSFPGLPFQREFTLPVWHAWASYQKQEGLKSRKTTFRADFAWPDAQVAVEVNGGIWRPGGHSTGQGITRDITKTTLAQLSGWVLIPLSDAHIFDGTPYWLALIADLIESRRSQRFCGHPAGAATRWCGPGPQPSHPQTVAEPFAIGSKQHGRTSRRKRRAERDRVDLRQELKSLRSGPGATTDLQR